ncbi:MAG: fumarylacetoacetate hydrolase family protein [Planctomycetota bacterium]|nr:MAG: fumarylacetoacetate hydrolase family protein [Planctomycetota bacterium]
MRRARRIVLAVVGIAVVGIASGVVGKEACCKKKAKVDGMVKEMLAARKGQRQIEYLTKTYGEFGIDEAYKIQLALAKEVSKELGPVVGYKVAYASKAAQEQFGVDEPASGPFFLLQRVSSGSSLPASAFMEVTLETEIAFTIGKRIDKPVKDVGEIKDYVKWVHTAFDIGDYRFVKGETKPTPADMIASGVGAHFFVLGPGVRPEKVDVDAVDLVLARNGKVIAKSPATNVMGSPWKSLVWCANHIVKLGGTLEPGMVVVSGTAAPAYKVKGEKIKGRYKGECGALGKVRLRIE